MLTDANMPEMDGFQLAEEIRKNPQLSGATIMMLTSAGSAATRRVAVNWGWRAISPSPSAKRNCWMPCCGWRARSALRKNRRLVTRHSLREERRPLRILLAEDNVVNQKLASRVLEKHGHSVVTAANGRQALERLENESFDLVLMDVQMPEIDGFEATATITKDGRGDGNPPARRCHDRPCHAR